MAHSYLNSDERKFEQLTIDDEGVDTDKPLNPPPPSANGKETRRHASTAPASRKKDGRNTSDLKAAAGPAADSRVKPPNNQNKTDHFEDDGSMPGGIDEAAHYETLREAERYGRQILTRISLSRAEHRENERELLDELVEAILILARRFDAISSEDDPHLHEHFRYPPGRTGGEPDGRRARLYGIMRRMASAREHRQTQKKAAKNQHGKEPLPQTRQIPKVGTVHAQGSVKLLHSRSDVIHQIRQESANSSRSSNDDGEEEEGL